jgi:hypothetical protein
LKILYNPLHPTEEIHICEGILTSQRRKGDSECMRRAR